MKSITHTARALRLGLLLSATVLGACSTMQATDTGFLGDRSAMTTSADGGTAHFRAATPLDPHQVRSLSVEWALPAEAGFSEPEKAQLLSTLQAAIAKEAQALPAVAGGRPLAIRALITRAESVSPVLNVVTAVLLTVPLDRGGAAVEIEVLDAETRQPLASMAHAYFVPVSEFRARFSRLAPAELALASAAVELAKVMQGPGAN
ncbi:hypothetical protein DIC66_08525 [Rhodoferax lacus]|uniref:DUF3313 domain-containing protein n=1 Tax=Rhodoferax lacus TaxID=2184758 RepID=A0A3E1RCT2_9BURK|nr:DUF3313 family protein [Rhodoferax lacus]RFO97177.1 hypothetical protein DIC66_08525 [Rhodoferax lacus]